MSVFLLGHRGVIGSAVAAYLRTAGIPYIGIDRESYAAHRGARAEILINAAGSSDRRAARSDPYGDFRENVVETAAILFDLPAERYVHVSTVGVYARLAEHAATSETAEIDPAALDPYGCHKAVAEVLVRRYARRWVLLRLGPIVGPGLRKNAIFDLVHSRRLYVHPDSRLPYIHTAEVARIAWELREASGEIFNVTGDGTVALSEVAAMLGIDMEPAWRSQPFEEFDIDIRKLKARSRVPPTRSALERYLSEIVGTERGVGSGTMNPPR